MMIFIAIVIPTLCFIYFLYLFSKKTDTIPTGLKQIPIVKGLPIIGVLHLVKPTLHHFLLETGKVYGPIFRIRLGLREFIVLNNFDVMKKSLKENGDSFSGRMKIKGFDEITHSSGIIFQDGDKWFKQRSFILKVFRDFGVGKSKSETIVQNECIHLLYELEKSDGKSTDFVEFVSIATANIISKFTMNKRLPRGDPKLTLISRILSQTIRKRDVLESLHIMIPCLDKIGFLLKYFKYHIFDEVYEIFRQEIKEHQSNLDFSSGGEDLIDKFLIEQKRMKDKTGSVDTFTDWQLIRNLFDLFFAGYETASTTLSWNFLFMAKYPEIQNKVHKEIIEQIGEERLPTMNDKKSLNYTQAVLDEILRWSTTAPIGLMHRNFNDCNINGYFVPKNSSIIPNLFACHFDMKTWENPDKFYPEHFLQECDNGQLKYNPREELNPFGMGKRQCLGESLARMELFLFFTSIIQKFSVRFTEELTENRFKEVLIGNEGFIRFSVINNFIFKSRS